MKDPDHTAAPSSSPKPNDTSPTSNGSGAEILKSFEGFLSFVTGLSIFGASTFAIIVSQIVDPNELVVSSSSSDQHPRDAARFSLATVRTFLAIAWLLFILALATVGASMALLAYQRENHEARFDGPWRKRWEVLGMLGSGVLQLLIIGAFLFLSLALVPYAEVVGWVAVGFAATAIVAKLLVLGVQCRRAFFYLTL